MEFRPVWRRPPCTHTPTWPGATRRPGAQGRGHSLARRRRPVCTGTTVSPAHGPLRRIVARADIQAKLAHETALTGPSLHAGGDHGACMGRFGVLRQRCRLAGTGCLSSCASSATVCRFVPALPLCMSQVRCLELLFRVLRKRNLVTARSVLVQYCHRITSGP
jgi:hypothetical protein